MIKHYLSTVTIACTSLFATHAQAQSPFDQYKNMFTPPLSYVVGYTSTPPLIDGNINDEVWAQAQWSAKFQDIEGTHTTQAHDTRVKMLWDDNNVYFAAELTEPHVWANLTERDQIVFFDNDFEIFIDPNNTGHSYFEVEINALNNIFDLLLTKPYRQGGHPIFAWDTQGMKHAINVQGSLNNASDTDKGWTVEIAIPHRALTLGNNAHVPKDNEIWRLNFSRVNWQTDIIDGKYVKRKDDKGNSLPEYNWVWSPQGVIDMHRPERWGYLQFSKKETKQNEQLPQFELPYSEKQRQYLWLLHYKQADFRGKNKRYAKTLKELGIDKLNITIDNVKNTISLSAIDNMYEAVISDTRNKRVRIDHEGKVTQ